MPYKVQVPNLPGGMVIEIEVETQEDIFREVHFWQSLPTVCPVDDFPTRLLFKNPGDYKYFGLVSSGPVQYEYKVGQHKQGKTLFPKEEWVLWDGTQEITVWQAGKMTPHGLALADRSAKQTGRSASRPAQAPASPPTAPDREPPPPDDDDARLWDHGGEAPVKRIRAKTIQEIATLALQAFPPRGMADKAIEQMLVLWASELDVLPDGFLSADLSVEQGMVLMEALMYRVKVAGLVAQAYDGQTLAQNDNEGRLARYVSNKRTPFLLGLYEDEKHAIVEGLEKKIADAKVRPDPPGHGGLGS